MRKKTTTKVKHEFYENGITSMVDVKSIWLRNVFPTLFELVLTEIAHIFFSQNNDLGKIQSKK